MGSDSPFLWTIDELGAAYRSGSTYPTEILELIEGRIDRLDSKLQSYITRTHDLAKAQAVRATEELTNGVDRGPLHGVPISLKDLIEVKDVRTTGGSRLLENNVSNRHAGVVESLNKSGAVLLGKNSTYEFGLGLPKPGDWPDPAKNPWDLDRIPGGSSSGSAAAVFAGMSFGAFGTDTGGSIRGPAAYCGVVGLKPTRGLIDLSGVLPLSETLDHVGPLGRTIGDVRALLSGATSFQYEIPREPFLLSKVVFGMPSDLIDSATYGPGVVENFYANVELLRSAGAEVRSIEMPSSQEVEDVLKSLVGYEAYAIHRATLKSDPAAYGRSGFERLSSGAEVSDDDLAGAFEIRERAIAQMHSVFDDVDWIVSPVTHTTAPTFVAYDADPTPRTLFTGLFNLVGAPALSMPGGLDENMMPIGFQVAGDSHSDARLLGVAASIEALIEFPQALSEDAAGLRAP
jgi:aspartyl-tRNA(Asn)/glutamyl-tRNA(Gln) amidotransferase subunit A